MTDTLNLKPCPFCGEAAGIVNVMKDGDISEIEGYTAACDVCNAELGGCSPFKEAEDAARNWNIRQHDKSEIRVTTSRCGDVLHLLRNPHGHSEEEMRKVRLYAADVIEELSRVESELKREAQPPEISVLMQAQIESIIRRHATGCFVEKDKDVVAYIFSKAEEIAKDILDIYPPDTNKREAQPSGMRFNMNELRSRLAEIVCEYDPKEKYLPDGSLPIMNRIMGALEPYLRHPSRESQPAGEISGIDVGWLADQFYEKGKQYTPAPSHYICVEFAKIVRHVFKHSRHETQPEQEYRYRAALVKIAAHKDKGGYVTLQGLWAEEAINSIEDAASVRESGKQGYAGEIIDCFNPENGVSPGRLAIVIKRIQDEAIEKFKSSEIENAAPVRESVEVSLHPSTE